MSKNIEKRLANTERALLGLWSLLEDTVPDMYAQGINEMMGDYFDANKSLGSEPISFTMNQDEVFYKAEEENQE